MKNRPMTTLFMIESLDGKISTGDDDSLDVDKDFKRITGVKEGLHQYYELEGKTDLVSLNSGRVMEKIGVNTRTLEPNKMRVSFVILDSKPHLDENGVKYLAKWVNKLYLVTTNKDHPVYKLKKDFHNIEIVEYENEINLEDLLVKMKGKYGVKRITIQSGGTLNSYWVRLGLIDRVHIVMAPCLIGGKNTQSLIGGESIHTEAELNNVKALELVKVKKLNNSYIDLLYKVISTTRIEQ